MLYPVKILNPDGSLKEVIPKEKVSKLHWDSFKRDYNQKQVSTNDTLTRRVRKFLEEQGSDLYEQSLLFSRNWNK